MAGPLKHIQRALRDANSVEHDDIIPTAPADAQPRQGCEHRVSVVLLRD